MKKSIMLNLAAGTAFAIVAFTLATPIIHIAYLITALALVLLCIAGIVIAHRRTTTAQPPKPLVFNMQAVNYELTKKASPSSIINSATAVFINALAITSFVAALGLFGNVDFGLSVLAIASIDMLCSAIYICATTDTQKPQSFHRLGGSAALGIAGAGGIAYTIYNLYNVVSAGVYNIPVLELLQGLGVASPLGLVLGVAGAMMAIPAIDAVK